MRTEVSLHDVFGIAEQVKAHSYVDRGGLDAQLRFALGAERQQESECRRAGSPPGR